MRTAIETGPKGKKFVAYAIDWPGLERNGKSSEEAFAKLDSYRARYRTIAERAGFAEEFARESASEIVQEYEGIGSTDFWGISFAMVPMITNLCLTPKWNDSWLFSSLAGMNSMVSE